MIRTLLCDLLGIELPIIQAPIGSVEGLALYAGQSVGLVKDVKPAATIIRELKRSTERVLRMGNFQPRLGRK